MAYYFSYDAELSFLDKIGLSTQEYGLLYVPEERHCTMLYSQGNYQEKYSQIILPNTQAIIKDVVVWENEKSNYLVALLDSDILTQYHELLKTKIEDNENQTHFNAHITLQKTKPEERTLSPEFFHKLKEQPVSLSGFRCINQARKNKLNIK